MKGVVLAALAVAAVPSGQASWPGGDPTAAPGTDFFRYANGGWIASNPIPPDRSGFSIATIVSRQTEERVRTLVTDAARTAPALPQDERDKVGAYYAAFMDETAIEERGWSPLSDDLADISRAQDRNALARIMGRANTGFDGSIFDLAIDTDTRNAERAAIFLAPGGLGDLDRDQYLSADPKVLVAYEAYIGRLLALVGRSNERAAREIIAFETKLAAATPSAADRRDDARNYNPTTARRLERDAPGFEWKDYLASAGVRDDRRLIATDRAAVSAFARVFATEPLPALKAWVTFHLFDNAAPFLSHAFRDAHFQFHGHDVAGKTAPPPRWRDGIRLVSGGGWKDMASSRGSMGDAVGRLYTARWFDPRSRAQLSSLVSNLRADLKAHIATSTWMSPETRAEALRKVADLRVEIGTPLRGDEYGGLLIRRDDLFGDVRRATAFQWRSDLARLDVPIDRARWTITPQTVNAYNFGPFNEVVFTAALLQPPAFDPDQDGALTYGGIGAIIGHELTHGFDDVGRRYDADGRQRDWWRGQDALRFQNKADALVGLFSSCEAAPGMHVDGRLTLGENIADIGGLQLAYAAYHASLGGKAAPVIGGLSGDQRFFLGFALLRRGHERDDALRADLHADPHTPDRCRVNEDVREIDGWYDAFGVGPGDPLYVPPGERVHFW